MATYDEVFAESLEYFKGDELAASVFATKYALQDEEGNFLNQEDFISGWLSNEDAWGRPAAPFVMSDGSLLISDDKYNVIYRVTYKG